MQFIKPDFKSDSSSYPSLAMYICILPLFGQLLALCKKHSFSFWHWENYKMFSTIRPFEKL